MDIQIFEVEPHFFTHGHELQKLDMVSNVRGSNFMLGIELVADKASKRSFDAEVGITERVFAVCRDLGVIVRPVGNLIILSPPLILNKEQCDKIIDTLAEAIQIVAKDLGR